MGGTGTEIFIILLLLVANGIFAGSELAVVASKKIRLQQRADEGDARARAALELARHPAKFLSTVQFGITLIGVLAGAYGGATIADDLALVLATIPRIAPYADAVALATVVAAITLASLIIGELVPKNIALRNPEGVASWVARPMQWLSLVGGPIVGLLTALTNLVLRVFGIRGQAEVGLTQDEIRAVISEGADSGVIAAAEETIVQRVFQLGDQRVAAIMTPRVDIEWIDMNASPDALHGFLCSHSHTQFVVCNGDLDNIVGIVRAAELLPIFMRGETIALRDLTREALFVPDSMRVFHLLESFRSSHNHVAIVMDEFGAVEGLVTVTDLLEALVGTIPGDASEARGAIIGRADGTWLVDGSASMEEVTEKFELAPLPPDEVGAYHTLAGFVMARLGRVPKCPDTFDWRGYRFEVVDMDGRRVDKVLVTAIAPPPGTNGESVGAGA